MKKRLKLKKQVKVILVCLVIFIIVLVFGIKKYKEYKYHQTNEYKLTLVGYSLEESKKIVDKLNDKNEEYLVKNKKNDYIIDLLDEKYFLEKNLDEYIKYKDKNKKKNLSDVVAIVNVHANYDWYDTDIVKPTDLSKNELILVNKFYYLDKSFSPEEITNISLSYAYANNSVSKVTNDAYINMATNAKKDGIQLLANSTYRTYERQEKVYKEYYDWYGEDYADKYAAHPGFSEHQTGLALDIFTYNSNMENFDQTEAFNWLMDNSYKYGFILRYPKGKEYLTGTNYESWHFRYIGEKDATKVHELGITFDEYYAYFIE